MKFSTSAILALANIVLATPVPESSSGLVKRAANAFAVGTRFNIDGSTNYFVGSNSYWISYLSNPADVDQTMAHLQASGLKVLRVWGKTKIPLSTKTLRKSKAHQTNFHLRVQRFQRRLPSHFRGLDAKLHPWPSPPNQSRRQWSRQTRHRRGCR